MSGNVTYLYTYLIKIIANITCLNIFRITIKYTCMFN